MFQDLLDRTIWPTSIDDSIGEILLSDSIREKLSAMFENEGRSSRIFPATSRVTIDSNHIFFSNHWYYLAVACKKYALALFPYCDFFDKKIRPNSSLVRELGNGHFDSALFSNLFDDENDKEKMTMFISGNSDFRPGKTLINDRDGGRSVIRSCRDIFGSCVLKKLPVPDASASFLGDVVYYLSKNSGVYNALEDEINNQVIKMKTDDLYQAPVPTTEWHESLPTEEELASFKGLLAFFVNQLNINNGTAEGEKFFCNGGTPAALSAIEKWNTFNGFALSCRFARGYQTIQDNANYINYAWVNINPHFDKTAKTVASLRIKTKPDMFVLYEGTSYEIKSLDLFSSDAPNENIIKMYNELREEVFKWQSGVYDHEAPVQEKTEDTASIQAIFDKRTNARFPLNCILYGAPGTGKTYATAQYALAIIEDKDTSEIAAEPRFEIMNRYNALIENGQIVFTTFHQNYGYEDFIQGIRPDTSTKEMSFKTVDGVFKIIADKACKNPGKNYVIIIDEINRANISKVFGELITLIEEDKRIGEENAIYATLPSGDPFAIPNNLYIIGTMNSADKSISLIDTALRRRFVFVEHVPNLSLISDSVLKTVLERLNNGIAAELNSTDLLVGHSYFMNRSADDLCDIMNRNIIPLLYEYFFDNKKKVEDQIKKAIEGMNVEIKSETMGRIKLVKKVGE